MAETQRVAVLGASGIGKHHAKWWALEGAGVCAFLGTSPESTEATAGVLKNLLGYAPRAYTDLGKLLEEERPHIVDVCTPPSCHAAHGRAALEAGCHVLCEKPFVFDEAKEADTLMAEARALVELARERGLHLGVCTQYAAGAQVFRELWERHRGNEAITVYHGHLESPARGRAPDPLRVWVDLAPHLISVMVHLWPEATVDWLNMETSFEGYQARAVFDIQLGDTSTVSCDLIARNAADPPRNVRHFKFNGYEFAVEGENDEAGIYRARIETPDGAVQRPDMMHLLIREMLAGRPIMAGAQALANLEIMLQVYDYVRAGGGEVDEHFRMC